MMQTTTIKTPNGTAVAISIDLSKVFSEDFKAIVRTTLVGHLLKEFAATRSNPEDTSHKGEAFLNTIRDIAECTGAAIQPMLNELMAEIRNGDVLDKELADLGITFADDKEK